MCFSKVSILLLYTLSIILISHTPFASSDEVNIEDLCTAYDNNGFIKEPTAKQDCINYLNSDPKFRSADYHDLSKFIMEHAVNKGLEDQNIFTELAKNHTGSKAIADCSQNYYPSTISHFRNALKKLDGDKEGAFQEVELALAGIQNCGTLLYQEKLDAAANSTISNMNNFMTFLTDLSSSAIELYSKE